MLSVRSWIHGPTQSFGDSTDVSQVHSQLLSQTPALASYACICLPTVGGGASAGQLLPILLFLGVHLCPPNCKVTEVSQYCKSHSSLILHTSHNGTGAGQKSLPESKHASTLSPEISLVLQSHHKNSSSTHYLLFIIAGLFST